MHLGVKKFVWTTLNDSYLISVTTDWKKYRCDTGETNTEGNIRDLFVQIEINKKNPNFLRFP